MGNLDAQRKVTDYDVAKQHLPATSHPGLFRQNDRVYGHNGARCRHKM